LIMYQKV